MAITDTNVLEILICTAIVLLLQAGYVFLKKTYKRLGKSSTDKTRLLRQKELAQTTLEALSEAVITTDENLMINYVNPAAEHILKTTKKDCQDQELVTSLNLLKENTRQPISIRRHIEQDQSEFEERSEALILVQKALDEITVKISTSPIRSLSQGIQGYVITIRDVSKARDLQKKLSYQASHDAVTGLLNRREFETRLNHLIEETQVDHSKHVLCYLDLDQFKIVNDTCGHRAGDELLRQLSNLFRHELRGSDSLARLGGDEFGVVLRDCNVENGVKIAEEIRSKIEEFRFTWENQIFSIGVSIGVVEIKADVNHITELMSLADAACYTAKNNGRNRVHLHQPNDEAIVEHRGQMRWAARIKNAIDEDRFRLFYQTIVPNKDSMEKTPHFEMFVRLLDEDNKLVSPGAFIPAAERFDLMTALDKWVLRNTFDWLAGLGKRDYICAINLSGTSINNHNFINDVIRKFDKYAVNPENICFEITETAAIANIDRAREFIVSLKELGCKFSLDDFGSGLSSFGYLKSLPVDYLKIDGMFIRDIISDPIDKAMVESINSIGHVLNLKTIAEFVEDEASLSEIRKIGVDYAQGYHIDKPTPIEEMPFFNHPASQEQVA